MLYTTVLKEGPGIPLVFLHGFLGSAHDWTPLCAHLPPCRCIGLDLPGHGNSPFVPEFTIPIPRFHLIGYSMGGRIAMAYSRAHPEQIASLTILSAHPGLNNANDKQTRWESDQKWAQLLLELPIDQFLTLWYNQPIFHSFHPDLQTRTRQNIPNLREALLHYSLAKQPFFEIEGVLVGEKDTKFRALYPDPVIVPRAGHMVHLENPKFVAEQILRVVTS